MNDTDNGNLKPAAAGQRKEDGGSDNILEPYHHRGPLHDQQLLQTQAHLQPRGEVEERQTWCGYGASATATATMSPSLSAAVGGYSNRNAAIPITGSSCGGNITSSSPSLPLTLGTKEFRPEEIESMLTKELWNLTAEERNKITEELHGVSVNVANEDDLDFVEAKLETLDREINKIRSKQAYDRASFLCPSYVSDRNFRLMFLRADEFVPSNAAKRIVSHFALKSKLFGLDKLVKDITLEDLSNDDILSLQSGSTQLLPIKDRAGRTMLVSHYKSATYKNCENLVRMYFCL